MKYIAFILTLLCLYYQTELQAVTSATTSTLQASIASTTNKHISKDEGSGIIKAQSGTIMGYDSQAERRRRMEFYAKRKQEQQATQQAEAKAQQAAILTYGTIGIVSVFIIVAIVAFGILYARKTSIILNTINYEVYIFNSNPYMLVLPV